MHIYFWFFLSFIYCETKYLCFTTGPVSNYKCTTENTVTEVNNETDFTPLITNRIKNTDTDVYIFLSGPLEFEFPFNIFNGKNLTVRFTDSTASGLFDVSDTSNIAINLLYLDYSSVNPNVTFTGSSFTDLQSMITLQNVDLVIGSTDIQLKSFKSIQSAFSFSKIKTNSFVYQVNHDLDVTFNNNQAVINDKTIEFINDNSNFQLIFSSPHKLIITNNGDTNFFPYFLIENAESITFNGNGFTESNSISLTNCPLIISNTDYIPLDSLKFTGFIPDFQLITSCSFTIKNILLNGKQNLQINASSNSISSRISVNINTLSLGSGFVQILSSWIDLTANSFKFETNNLPISPCLGYGGSSTFVATQSVYLGSSSTFQLNSLSINLDIIGSQTDQTLSNLLSKPWNSIKFESFAPNVENEEITTITFSPENINGFGTTEADRVVKFSVTSSNNLIVTVTASSLNTIPLLVCYTDSPTCEGGVAINDLSKLSEVIPIGQKTINLSIAKEGGEIDLTSLKTQGATFSIIQAKKSSATVKSITMDEEYPNKKIEHLFLQSIHFGTGFFDFNANEITFEMCRTTEEPNISFNANSVLNIDDYSYEKLRNYFNGTYPITNFFTAIDQCYSSFEITESKYVFKNSFGQKDFPFREIPKVVFHIGLSSNDDYQFDYKVSTSSADSVTLKFASHKLYTNKFNPKVTVNFNNFEILKKANKIEVDFDGLTAGNTINLNNVPNRNYFTFNGENIVIKNAAARTENNFCVCKETPCSTGVCDSDMTQIAFSELNEKVQKVSEDILQITVVAANDGSSPTLSLSSLNNKNAKIAGVGVNSKITIDCSTKYTSPNYKLEFGKINVACTGGNALEISNLILDQDCTIDSSFKSVSLTSNSLQCFVSHLVFTTVKVNDLLQLSGDARNTQSTTKVSFASSSTFSYKLPSSITIKGSKLVFNNLEFDLTNVLISFSFSEELTEFTIAGENGDFSSLASDLVLEQTSNLKTVYISGTWNVANTPSKFIHLKKFSSDLYLDSESIPLSVTYLTNEKIVLERETVNILGTVTFKGSYSGNYIISSSSSLSSSRTTLSINHAHISSGIANVQFSSTNIDLNIDTYTSESVSPKFKFFLLIDLNGQNLLTITNSYRKDVEFTYDVHCTINEKLSDEKMKNFISNNHTLIVINHENTIKYPDSITFDEDATIGFNNDNFKLTVVNGNKLIFYTHKSPLIGDVNFYYGKCTSSCTGTELKKEDFSRIDQLIPMTNDVVTITFYDSVEDGHYIDLNKQGLTIYTLTLKSSFSAVKKSANIIFGNSVTYLNLDCITLNNLENDEISLKKATLKKGSSFGEKANLADVESIVLDQDSIFESKFTEFSNDLSLTIITSTYITLNFTSTGMKIIKSFNSQLSIFNIDVSKMPNVCLTINSKETPKINLEKGVTQLKQIKTLLFDSSTFNIGSNWDKLTDSKVQYSFNSMPSNVIVTTDSFPFSAWDLMYEHTVRFSDVLSPFIYKDEFELEDKEMKFSTYIPTLHKYNDITFNELVMSRKSAIIHAEETSTKKLIVKKLEVEENAESRVVNGFLTDEIELERGSSLQGDFTIDPYVLKIEIEWDLQHLPLLSPSVLQSVHPGSVTLVYKGPSISGNEKEVDKLLLNGATFMKNVQITASTLSKIHFTSESESSFNDGEKLALECRINEANEVQLFTTRSFSGITATTAPTQPRTKTSTSTTAPTQPQTESSSSKTATTAPTEPQTNTSTSTTAPTAPVTYTLAPVYDSLSVDDSLHLMSDKIRFLQHGFVDGDMTVDTTQNRNDVLLIRAHEKKVKLMAETTQVPNQHLFLSPIQSGTEFSIEKLDNYGYGQFGVHANSEAPRISIQSAEVPLNLYSQEDTGRATLVLGDHTSEDSFTVKLSLGKVTINKGRLNLDMPKEVHDLEFYEVESYQTAIFEPLSNGFSIKPTIHKMTVKNGSHLLMTSTKLSEKLSLGFYSTVEIESDVTFGPELTIELTSLSLIELGSASITGVCKEIRMVAEKSPLLNSHEVNVELICGNNFNCSEWIGKYVGDETFKTAKCIVNKRRETCLVASDKTKEEINKEKKKSSIAVIIGIVVGVVGVLAIIITLVVRCVRSKTPGAQGYVSPSNAEEAAPQIEEVETDDGGHIDV